MGNHSQKPRKKVLIPEMDGWKVRQTDKYGSQKIERIFFLKWGKCFGNYAEEKASSGWGQLNIFSHFGVQTHFCIWTSWYLVFLFSLLSAPPPNLSKSHYWKSPMALLHFSSIFCGYFGIAYMDWYMFVSVGMYA